MRVTFPSVQICRWLVSAVVVILLLLAIAPSVHAKSFRIDSVTIEATVNSDGSMTVSETRTYSFDGRFSWADYTIPLDRVGRVTDFRLGEGSLAYTPGTDRQPGTYEVSSTDDRFSVRWAYSARNERRSFTLEYTITDVVTVYSDVAELYFKFVGEANTETLGAVRVALSLPQPAVFGEVRAWAHGPSHGRVDFAAGTVRLEVSPLPARRFWEARVTFPAAWTPDAARQQQAAALDRILEEEDRWARQANTRREREALQQQKQAENNRLAGQIGVMLAGVGLLVVVLGYIKVGRGFSVPYSQQIDSTLPAELPALVSYFYFQKRVHGGALSSTLLDLAHRGFLQLEQSGEKPKWWKSGPDFLIRLDIAQWTSRQGQLRPYENDLIEFLFDDLAGGDNVLTAKQLRRARSKMQRWFRSWKKKVRNEAGEFNYYDPPSTRATTLAACISGAILLAGIVLAVTLGERAIIAVVGGGICLLLSFTILRYTPEVKLKRKKLEALRRYLKKYHFLSDGVGIAGRDISDYVVYSLALGVGQKSLEKLFGTLSEDDRQHHLGWYVHPHGSASPADFAQAVTAVVAAATSTVSSSAGAGGGAAAGGGGGGGGASGGAG